MTASLYERLGGETKIAAVVHDLLDNHLANPIIATRFSAMDRPTVERHAVEFFCAGTGGPQAYTGKDMVSTHKHMNITEQELVAVIDDALLAMTKHGYDQSLKNEVLAILYSLKGEVLHL